MRQYFELVLSNKLKESKGKHQKQELYSQHLWTQLISKVEKEEEQRLEMNWDHIDQMSLESILENFDDESDELLPSNSSNQT